LNLLVMGTTPSPWPQPEPSYSRAGRPSPNPQTAGLGGRRWRQPPGRPSAMSAILSDPNFQWLFYWSADRVTESPDWTPHSDAIQVFKSTSLKWALVLRPAPPPVVCTG
jgi:hypothetical protein